MSDPFDQQLRALIDEAGKRSIEHLPTDLKFNKSDNSQLAPVCIYASVVELYHGCMALLAADQYTALPVIIRSMMESHADIKASSADRDYWRHLHSNSVSELLRLADNVTADHRFLAAVFVGGDVEARKKALLAELKTARDGGRGPISTKVRFEKAQLGPEYESIYWNLCLEGHNNLSALEGRHLDYDGEHFHVVAFRQDWSMLRAYLDAMLVILIGSSQIIHRMFDTGAAERFDQLEQQRSTLIATLSNA